MSSPKSMQQSLTATESTAALSWISSNSEIEPEIYSEEGASNCYDDYCYHSDDDSTSGGSSSWSEVTYSSSEDSTYESANVLSAFSHKQCVTEVVLDVRHAVLPGNLTVISKKPLSSDQKDALERKTVLTSKSRSLYRESRSAVSTQEGTNERVKNYPYPKRERPGSATSRLRADLAAIAERRAMLTNMLQSVSERKNQDFDMASTILSVSTVSQSIVHRPSTIVSAPNDRRSPRPIPSETESDNLLPRDIYVSPSPRTQTEKPFFDSSSERDAQHESLIESFGSPISERYRGFVAGKSSFGSACAFDWENALGGLLQDSESESMFYSDSKTGATDESPPIHILVKVKETKSKRNEPPRPTRSADLNPVVRSIESSHCVGLNQSAHLTDDIGELQGKCSSLNNHPRSPWTIAHDYMIPYNIEDRFCGGLYHIASLSSPPSQLAEF
jgi:hypothetical protein